MSLYEKVIGVAVAVALLGILSGLVVRGRWRVSWLFSLYVAATLAFNLLFTWVPDRFHFQWFWAAAHDVLHALKIGVSVEIGVKTFRFFPGARSAVGSVILGILAIGTLATLAAQTGGAGDAWPIEIALLQPRLVNSAMWLMVAVLALGHWYRVPLHPFHSAVLGSFAVYLALFSTMLTLLGNGWLGPYANYARLLEPVAYLVLTCWWANVAWRSGPALAATHAATMRRLERGDNATGERAMRAMSTS